MSKAVVTVFDLGAYTLFLRHALAPKRQESGTFRVDRTPCSILLETRSWLTGAYSFRTPVCARLPNAAKK